MANLLKNKEKINLRSDARVAEGGSLLRNWLT
ncbi:MAG: hypothetical protein MRECE_27c001, partial [Mycoplasmataceae bacterium CE_OT135]